MKKWQVDFTGSLFVEAENEEGAYNAACDIIKEAKKEAKYGEVEAIEKLVGVIQASATDIYQETD